MGAGVTHKCLDQALEGRCPICMESLRTSTKPLKALACAHVMHDECYKRCRKDRYTCRNTTAYFGVAHAETQQLLAHWTIINQKISKPRFDANH